MITRIEIDGFKTFQDFAVDLEPFQVIIGPNGCGKSNFFDALDLLSKTATSDLRTAFKSIRGDINELFTVLPNGKSADHMRFTVEMLVNDASDDDRHVFEHFSKMRYHVEIRRRDRKDGLEELYVHDEHLVPLPIRDEDKWTQEPKPDKSAEEHVYARTNLNLFSDKSSDKKMPRVRLMRQQMQNLRLVRLNTDLLRKSSSFFDEPVLTETGENLPATLARIQIQDKPLLKSVSRDVSSIVPNFAGIEVDRDTGQKRITLYANMKDKRRFSMEALSEGTLRVLALATLRNDPQLRGTLCFEDPEAGVHPGAFARIVKMLRSMATNLNNPEDLKLPLRQVLVTTHSPELVSHLNIEQGELLFADSVTRVVPGDAAWRVTRIVPVCSDGEQGPAQTYALSKVIEYLNNPGAAEKQNSLREAMLR